MAKVNWIKHGDLNTAFFHKITNMRNRKNKILSLEIEGEAIKDEDRTKGAVHEHFKKLFGDKAAFRWLGQIPIGSDSERGSSDALWDITKRFSEEETKASVWGLDLDDSSRPDGFLIFFFIDNSGILLRHRLSIFSIVFTRVTSNSTY